MQKTKSASKKLAHSGTKSAAVESKNKTPREKLQPKSVKPAKKSVPASAHVAKKDAGGKKKAASSGATKKVTAAPAPAKKAAVVQVIKKASTVKPAAAKSAKETSKETSKETPKDHASAAAKSHAKDAKKKTAEPAHAPKTAKASEKEAPDKGKIVKKAGESHVVRKASDKSAEKQTDKQTEKHAEKHVEKAAKAKAPEREELLDDEALEASAQHDDGHDDGHDGDHDADGDIDEALNEIEEEADEVTADKPEPLQAKAPKEPKARKVPEEETPRSNEPADDEIVLTDADGRRYCRVKECDQIATVDGGYCRYHYLLFWRNIQNRKKILSEGKLARYIEELTARYPDKYLELLRKDLRSEKDFTAAIQELEIDESGVDAEFEDEAQNYLDEVRGMGSETSNEREEDF